MQKEGKKLISIATDGPIPVYNSTVNGPIRTPFYESYSNIARLISSGVEVYEHLSNGEKIRLNMTNFDVPQDKPTSVPSKNKRDVKPTPIKNENLYKKKEEKNKKSPKKGDLIEES